MKEMNLKGRKVKVLNQKEVIEVIKEAIKTNTSVEFFYNGDEKNQQGFRDCELYAFGKSGQGNYLLRAYQTEGNTISEVPGWKLFRVDKIMTMELKSKFDKPRPLFNPKGDRGMAELISLAKFK